MEPCPYSHLLILLAGLLDEGTITTEVSRDIIADFRTGRLEDGVRKLHEKGKLPIEALKIISVKTTEETQDE